MLNWSPTDASNPHSNRSSLIHFCSFQANRSGFVVVIGVKVKVDVDVDLGDGLGVEVEVDSVTT